MISAGIVHHVAKLAEDAAIVIAVVCFVLGSVAGFFAGRISKRQKSARTYP